MKHLHLCLACDGKGFHSCTTETSASSVTCKECHGEGVVEQYASRMGQIRMSSAEDLAELICRITEKNTCDFCADISCRGNSENKIRCIKGVSDYLEQTVVSDSAKLVDYFYERDCI